MEHDPQLPSISVDDSVQYSMSGSFRSEGDAQQLAEKVHGFITYYSRSMDLSGLGGVTIADDLRQAVHDLDRGYTPSSDTAPTNNAIAVAIATTQTVIRDGQIKSHIVFSRQSVSGIADDPTSEMFQRVLRVILHECAHVEATRKFDSQFRNVLLQPVSNGNLLNAKRWDCILACYQEYVACWRTAWLSKSDTELQEFLEVFFQLLSETRPKADAMIVDYASHQDHARILAETFDTYGNLMKHASYVLGTMHGLLFSLEDVPDLRNAIEGNWFESVFKRLCLNCSQIRDSYGQWRDKSLFEEIGNLLEMLVRNNGIAVARQDDGTLNVELNSSGLIRP